MAGSGSQYESIIDNSLVSFVEHQLSYKRKCMYSPINRHESEDVFDDENTKNDNLDITVNAKLEEENLQTQYMECY